MVENVLSDLTPEQKEVFFRCCRKGETSAEAAKAMNKTPNAIDQVLHRARKHIIRTLKKQGVTEVNLRDYLVE